MRLAATLIGFVLVLAACDNAGSRSGSRTRTPKKRQSEPADPVPVQKKQVVSFQGDGFITERDFGSLGIEMSEDWKQKLKGSGYSLVSHIPGNTHKYTISPETGADEVAIEVTPCVDASDAGEKCSQGMRDNDTMGKNAMTMGTASYSKVYAERVVGSNGWVSESIKTGSKGIAKVGGHHGAFYIVVTVGGHVGNKEEISKYKEHAAKISQFVVGKLR